VKPKKPEFGQGLLEYALLLLLVGVSILLVLRLMGLSVRDVYCDIVALITNQDSCSNQVLCSDSFDDPAFKGWNWVYGAPSMNRVNNNPGQLCLSNSNQLYNQCSQNKEQKDYSILMKNSILYNGNGYGIFFRTTYLKGKANGYIFQYDPGLRAFVIRRWVDGKEINPPFAKTPIPPNYPIYNTPHDIKIDVIGNNYVIYIDGQKILDVTDDVYQKGGIGLRTWDSTNFCTDEITLFSAP